ncbi:HTH-type transcriptional regulator PgrR [Acetobacter pasteurianus]|uniref:HTH-type transcriptional regulator PgrR n=4 Tax=Acetobacter pasteurianus TaxID=438 RepID=A0A1A0DK97_ACEPA|nr:LysR substrate-binding domain-containing protein [Acetobacter pasteurianus]OAZ75693.1 HTH-type transcriptional regulator PgrR [Acetobacter pasteurianus]GCD49906.1 transcriptional regulator [Acetobacter pasteurianus subsp. pasteurianus LMG 1262 = NBRC 106471]
MGATAVIDRTLLGESSKQIILFLRMRRGKSAFNMPAASSCEAAGYRFSIRPDVLMAVVATPMFLKQHGSPRNPRDLAEFPCINLRLPTPGELFPWQFRKSGKDIRITTSGQLVLTSLFQIREACLGGLGLAWLPHDLVASRIATGELVEVLSQWQKVFEPYHLYYPSRRQHSSAMAAFIAALQASLRE